MATPAVVHLRNVRASQPAAAVGNTGVIFCVTDEGDILERSNGTTWESYSPASVDESNVAITGGSITGITDLAIADGGTGASTKTVAFDNLSPTTTAGDLIFNDGTDNVRLGIGTALQLLRTNAGATAPEWATVSVGTGDVSSASTLTDNAVVRGDGGAKGVQTSGVIIDDSNNVSGVVALAATTIELGHASDTTLARSGAGDITVEGNAVYRAGGTDVPVADGGTGVSSLTAYAPIFGGTTGTGAVQSGTVGTATHVLTSNGPGALPTFQAPASGSGITLATPQATTSGTTKDFTGIPSGTKRITVSFNGMSLSGTSPPMIQLGDSGGIEATGYSCVASSFSGAISSASATTGFNLINAGSAAYLYYGQVILSLMNSTTNTWSCSGVNTIPSVPAQCLNSGIKALSAELDRIRITAVNGTDTFDAGEVNISYQS